MRTKTRSARVILWVMVLLIAETLSAQAITSEKEGNTHFSKILFPEGASYSGAANETGVITIKLPVNWSNTMLKVKVQVYNYVNNTSFSIDCYGYAFNGAGGYWTRTGANFIGDLRYGKTVRFGHDGSVPVILIGEEDTNWKYFEGNGK